MKPECSVTQSSAMTHPCKCAIADASSGKNIFSTVGSSITKSEGAKGFCLI